uniref:Uncharacterized protein n=1 Tax=Helianthus annuus TaxID=4232 RepID=A0A251RTD8_HELAN
MYEIRMAQRRRKAQVTQRHNHHKIAVNLMLDCGAFGANTQLSTFTRFRFMLLMMNGSKTLFCHMMLSCV